MLLLCIVAAETIGAAGAVWLLWRMCRYETNGPPGTGPGGHSGLTLGVQNPPVLDIEPAERRSAQSIADLDKPEQGH